MARMTNKAKSDFERSISSSTAWKIFKGKGYNYMAVCDKKEDALAYAKGKRDKGFLVRISNKPVVRGGRKVNRYMIWGTPK